MMLEYCYLNGNIMPFNKACLPLNDLGILRGFGIFDYFRTYNGKPFMVDEHLERLFHSARNLYLEVPETKERIKEIIQELLKKNNVRDASLRFVLTGGPSPDGFSLASPSFFILVENIPEYPPENYENGVHLMAHEHLRIFPELKTNNYITAIHLQKERKEKNAFDILYTSNGNVLECTRSNFFVFRGNKLITPVKEVLIGRTRNLILDLAKDHFEIEERDIPIEELKEVDEAFLTGTSKKVMPVRSVDDIIISDGKVGPNTRKMIALFEEYIKNY